MFRLTRAASGRWPRRRLEPWYFYAALTGYVAATYPAREWKRRSLGRQGRALVLVITYHRVADDHANSWTCSNRTFERHLDWLAKRFDLVSLSEAQRRMRDGNRSACVAITFDDGYGENCDTAMPLLVKRGIPCTYFVTYDNVSQGIPFEHDVAMGNRFRPNTPAELADLVAAGIEIGCHGRTHRDVAQMQDPREVLREIVTVRRDLEALVGSTVRYYAFPFGQRWNLSSAGFAAARQAGYLGACSDYGSYNLPGEDAFHVKRHSGTEDMIRLVNWATFDPRKASMSFVEG